LVKPFDERRSKTMAYLLHISILIGIYSILAVSLNLIAGYAGMLSIAHAAFYGVGAYVTALMALKLQTGFWLNLPCAMLAAGILGGLVSLPALRIRDDYLAVVTFGFQVIIFSILNNWTEVTGGSIGLPGIPAPIIFGQEIATADRFLLLTLVCCAGVVAVAYRMVYSPFGRVLQAIREDEVFALSLGKSVTTYKVLAFIVGASMAAIAGGLYAYYIRFIDPSSFTVMESIFIISIVTIGGFGNFWGAIVGTISLVVFPELLRFVGLPTAIAANVRQILYGSLLIAIMIGRASSSVERFESESRSKGDFQ
jgi:branched-chain amino acid transport system permease protein